MTRKDLEGIALVCKWQAARDGSTFSEWSRKQREPAK